MRLREGRQLSSAGRASAITSDTETIETKHTGADDDNNEIDDNDDPSRDVRNVRLSKVGETHSNNRQCTGGTELQQV